MTNEKQISVEDKKNIPKWFNIAATVALIWNLMGIIAFVMHIMMAPDMIAKLPQAEQVFYATVPLWATIAFTCAVFGGTLGALALLMKKTLAFPLLVLSLLGVVTQMFHSFVIGNSFEVFGPSSTIMPTMVLIIAIALIRLVSTAKNNGWLN